MVYRISPLSFLAWVGVAFRWTLPYMAVTWLLGLKSHFIHGMASLVLELCVSNIFRSLVLIWHIDTLSQPSACWSSDYSMTFPGVRLQILGLVSLQNCVRKFLRACYPDTQEIRVVGVYRLHHAEQSRAVWTTYARTKPRGSREETMYCLIMGARTSEVAAGMYVPFPAVQNEWGLFIHFLF